MSSDRREPPLVTAARRAGVDDPGVLAALAATPRERFVPPDQRDWVDVDRPLPIGQGQTTSQPSLIAAMVTALHLDGHERVLEIGTGYGYQTAILTHLAAEVYSIERSAVLAARARENLEAAGVAGWHVEVGDGTQGLPAYAPYDAIVVAAAAAELPRALGGQLRDGGLLVIPVGQGDAAEVVVYEGRGGELEQVRRLMGVRFVPLVPGPVPDGTVPDGEDHGGA